MIPVSLVWGEMWDAGVVIDHAPGECSAAAPSAGIVLGRGAGYGAAFGAVFGIFLIPVAGLLSVGGDSTDLTTIALLTVVVAPFTAMFGLLYGTVAGLVAAGVMALVPAERRTDTVVRPSVAVCAALSVAAVSWIVFRPSLTVGGNESNGHVIERVVLFYAYPAASALIAGALVGHRLVAPRVDDAVVPPTIAT